MTSELHEMEKTNKIITIIGLVFEGVSVFVLFITYFFMKFLIDNIPYDPQEMSLDEYNYMVSTFDWVMTLLIVMGIILGVFFIINVFLFPKLIRGKYTYEQAKKVYLYQAIYGGVNLLFNQITGILYLISGVRGFNNEQEMKKEEIRDGI